MSGFEIAAGASMAVEAYGQISGASAKAQAEAQNAQLKRAQADELLKRQTLNETIMRQKANEDMTYAGSEAGASGLEGTGIGAMLKIKKNVDQNIYISRRESEYKAAMLRSGADIDTQLSSDIQTAGMINAGGTLLGGAAEFYKLEKKPSKPSSLPEVL